MMFLHELVRGLALGLGFALAACTVTYSFDQLFNEPRKRDRK